MVSNTSQPVVMAYLGLGSNIGDKAQAITQALGLIEVQKNITILKRSHNYKTAPWGDINQDWFINACVLIETSLTAHQLLESCLNIERQMGRQRHQKWGARNIDIDILDYDQQTIKDAVLSLPHPYAHRRNFVIIPLAEIAPKLILQDISVGERCLLLSQEEQDDVSIY